jgi:pimeloyl-ACP methyl ester carboxylesterase
MSSFRHPGLVLTDHAFEVPLDHERPDGARIEVYAREVVAAERAEQALPWLVFLQGGPGFGAPRPVGRDDWLDRALRDFRVLLLDQRGTGRSTPVNRRTLPAVGDPKAQAAYLTHFRADSIVLDAELIRRALIGDEKWSVLGQSYGGFCTVTYLSYAPHGMREAFITGGLPGLTATAEDVYHRTYKTVLRKNAGYYATYPDDVEPVREIARVLLEHDIRLPDGRRLTAEGLQWLGHALGSGAGAHRLHYLLEDASADGIGGLSDTFLHQVMERLSLAGAPIYALLHEACYAQGGATNWAAQRVRAEFPEFDAGAALDADRPVMFTGEMIYPWMVESDPALAPLAETARILAEYEGWRPLYDPARLAANEVPVAAAVYYDDMYVDRELSMATAEHIRGLKPLVTNSYEHDGLRTSGGSILDNLIGKARGTAR